MNTDSLRAKLLNISKEKGISFQELLNRFGSEQFLLRLSKSPYREHFIFKGGALLSYLIETDRKTRDLDFSVRQVSNNVEQTVSVIQKILAIDVDDGLTWNIPTGEQLNHPELDLSGDSHW